MREQGPFRASEVLVHPTLGIGPPFEMSHSSCSTNLSSVLHARQTSTAQAPPSETHHKSSDCSATRFYSIAPRSTTSSAHKVTVDEMPISGRGPPMPKGSRKWSEEELSFLHICEVELKDLSKDQRVDLWNAVFPQILEAGWSYNYAKLHETWQYRHYPGRNEMWQRIARPHNMEGNARTDLHTQDERKKFEAIRRKIRTAAQGLGIALATPTRRVDDGTTCDCNVCQGKVKHRKPTLDDDGNVKKSGARGQSANKRSSDGTTASASSSNRRGQMSAQMLAYPNSRLKNANESYTPSNSTFNSTTAITHRTRRTQPVYAMGSGTWEGDEADDAEDDDAGSVTNDQEDSDDDFTAPGQQQSRLISLPTTTRPARRQAPVNGRTDSGNDQVIYSEAEDSEQSHGTPERSRFVRNNDGNPRLLSVPADTGQSASGEATAAEEQTHALKLKECHVALDDEDAIPMFHYRDLVVCKSKWRLMLHPRAEPIPQQDPVRKHGGPIMMIHQYESGLAYPYMICDKARCQDCNKSADPTMGSRTYGFGFVHARHCLPDEESNVMLVAPEAEDFDYAPCQEYQAFKVREVVLGHEGGPLKHELAVCDEVTCMHCRGQAGLLRRGFETLTLA